MKEIIILGTGGNCIDILDTINEINKIKLTYKVVGFLDDDVTKQDKLYNGIKVIGTLGDAQNYKAYKFINGIGSQSNFWLKKVIIDKTNIPLSSFETIIHPKSSVSDYSNIGKGVVILANTTICSNVNIGNHVFILSNSAINHNVKIGDYSCIASGVCVSGNVDIGQGCYMGASSTIINSVNIHDNVLIGMGSNVLENVSNNRVVVGNPAKYIRSVY